MNLNRALVQFCVLSCLAVALGACDSVSYDTQLDPVVTASSASLTGRNGSALRSNSVKYSDKGRKLGVGRSGSATLEIRSLIGKDGSTLVEASTGSLDSRTPGTSKVEKVQLKVFDPDHPNSVILTSNYNKLVAGGLFTKEYQGLVPGMPIEMKAILSTPSSRGKEVVVAKTAVYLRPDLEVVSVSAPTRALPNVPVAIHATLSEKNGDVGAHASCVLYVDGQKVDHADGIWVDAGDEVGCAFSHTFQTTGTKELNVALEQTSPADWDISNNSKSGSIEITPTFSYSAGAYSMHPYIERSLYEYQWESYDGHYSRYYDYATRNEYYDQQAYITLSGNTEFTFPIAELSINETSGGSQISSFLRTNLNPPQTQPGPGWTNQSIDFSEYGRSGYIYVSLSSGSFTDAAGTVQPYSYVDYYRSVVEVMYFAQERGMYLVSEYPVGPIDHWDNSYEGGTVGYRRFSGTLAFDFKLTDGSRTISIAPLVQLTEGTDVQPERIIEQSSGELCDYWDHPDFQGDVGCGRYSWKQTESSSSKYSSGYVSGDLQPM